MSPSTLLAGLLPRRWKVSRTFRDRRTFDRLFVDKLDLLHRWATGRRDLPPYSLRRFVGGSTGFEQVGPWFLEEFRRLGLLPKGCRILDVGCGCGRLASTFARDSELVEQDISYVGMDIDQPCVDWCRRRITPLNPAFRFYHVDLGSSAYNPAGKIEASHYRFPHEDESFDLIVATSLFTHLLEPEARRYLREIHRLLSPAGRVYASFFLVQDENEAMEGTARHGMKFPFCRDQMAFASETQPEAAVAFHERHARELLHEIGFELAEDIFYGVQDNLLLRKAEGAT